LKNIIQLCSEVNKYVNDSAPWSLKEDNLEKRNVIIYVVLDFIRKISILLQPVIPEKTKIILDSLNINQNERYIKNINKNYSLKPNNKIQKIPMMKATKTLLLARIMRNVKECGINTEQKKTMDFAKFV
jgi:methionyl-tRNA synthetase